VFYIRIFFRVLKTMAKTTAKTTVFGFTKLDLRYAKQRAISQSPARITVSNRSPPTAEFFTKVACFSNANRARYKNAKTPARDDPSRGFGRELSRTERDDYTTASACGDRWRPARDNEGSSRGA
jgi:hypothetical protein